MAQLFPVFDAPAVTTSINKNQPKYPRSLRFDFAAGDFILDGTGRLLEVDGYGAWVQWCEKAVCTERLAHIIYSPNFGAEIEKSRKQPNRQTIQSALEREITESLLVDPRTESVRAFTFSWSGDNLHVSFTVYPKVGTSRRLEVNY